MYIFISFINEAKTEEFNWLFLGKNWGTLLGLHTSIKKWVKKRMEISLTKQTACSESEVYI